MLALHPYQRTAVAFLRGTPRAGLFLDMGLGKTCICLTALQPHHLPALVVAPKNVAEMVWDVERDKWRPDLTVAKATGGPAKRAAAIGAKSDITVISRDNLADVLTVGHRRYRTVIIDELSGYKNPSARTRYKLMRKVLAQEGTEHVWGLTGTPVPNGYLDLWSQVALLDGGQRLGRTVTGYRSRYFYPTKTSPQGFPTAWELHDGAQDKINAKIEDICLSMTSAGRIVLPALTVNDVPVELPARAKSVYRDFQKDLAVDITDLLGGEIHTAASAAVLSNKLSQISAGFLFSDDNDINGKYTRIHTAKMDALAAILGNATSPVVVFYRYRPELEMLTDRFPHGRKLAPNVAREWNLGLVPLMFAHPASAGHGLNLQQGGHTAVWTSLNWSSEEYDQANKRLYRQGQKYPVVIHRLMTNRSVDHVIAARLAGKADVQSDLMTHLESPI